MNRLLDLDVTADVIAQLESHETPLRIQGPQQTYYVLSAEQMLALMQPTQMLDDNGSFTPQDFGLTEENLTGYEARRRERRQHVDTTRHSQLTADLQNRLDLLRSISALSTDLPPVDQQTLQALEAAMLYNLQSTTQNARL
jgi:hypothetical protein